MWPTDIGICFFCQGQALVYAKAVLLIDDHQPQFCEGDIRLEQGMGSYDQERLAAGDTIEALLSLFPL